MKTTRDCNEHLYRRLNAKPPFVATAFGSSFPKRYGRFSTPSGDGYIFAQDFVFASPYTAAGVVQGRAANGRVNWKTKDGQTLKDLQEAEAKA